MRKIIERLYNNLFSKKEKEKKEAEKTENSAKPIEFQNTRKTKKDNIGNSSYFMVNKKM